LFEEPEKVEVFTLTPNSSVGATDDIPALLKKIIVLE
jgi:hypothetical protein